MRSFLSRATLFVALLAAAFVPAAAQTLVPGTANAVWRDFNVDGVQSSGPYNPQKPLIRQWGRQVESAYTSLLAGQGTGALAFDTFANLNASLNYPPNAAAYVFADIATGNNGIYRKIGNPGTGSWARVSGLIFSNFAPLALGSAQFVTDTALAQISIAGPANAPLLNLSIPRGTKIYPVVGAPSNSLGIDGDFAIDDASYAFYGPKVGGVWPAASMTAQASAASAAVSASTAASDRALAVTAATQATGALGAFTATVANYETYVGALATYIIPGAQSFTTRGYSSAGDGGEGFYKKITAPASPKNWQKQSADGAWWEPVPQDGWVSVKQFGARCDWTPTNSSPSDDWQSFEDAKTFLVAHATAYVPGVYVPGAGGMRLPLGVCYLTKTHEMKGVSYTIQGAGGRMDYGNGSAGPGTVILMAPNTTGIIVQGSFTTGNTTENPGFGTKADGTGYGSGGAVGSIIENLTIRALPGTIGNTANGVRLRADALLRNVAVVGFPQDGINIVASSGGSLTGNAATVTAGALYAEGAASFWQLENVSSFSNGRDGLHVKGADANIGSVKSGNFSLNARWGIFDDSFLGNYYSGTHTTSNGVWSSTPYAHIPSVASYGGNRYFVVLGQDALASTSQPDISPSVWQLIGPGGPSQGAGSPTNYEYAQWTNGGQTWNSSGPYAFGETELNSRSVLLGAYSEGGQMPSQINAPSVVMGGLHGAGFSAAMTGSTLSGSQSGLAINNSVFVTNFAKDGSGWTTNVQLGDGAGGSSLLKFTDSRFMPSGYGFNMGSDLFFQYANSGATTAFTITGPNTTQAYGHSAPVPYAVNIERLFAGVGTNARQITTASSIPTGSCTAGDLALNTNNVELGSTGSKYLMNWQCAGLPGAWFQMRSLTGN